MSPRKLWQRSFNGAEIEACLWHDHSLGEATCEIAVKAAHSDDLAVSFANTIRKALMNAARLK
jgi:hypothetical protein